MKYGKKLTLIVYPQQKLVDFTMNINRQTMEIKFGIDSDGGQQEEPFY